MTSGAATVKQLIRELEQGKKKLRLEYNKGLRALDEAISTLHKLELDAAAVLKKNAGTEIYNLSKLVGAKSGKRGRPVTEEAKPGITQLIFEAVKHRKKFMHQREIVQVLVKKFPEEDTPDFSKKISVLLAALKRQGRLITIKKSDSNRDMYWGLPEFSKKLR